MLQGAASHTTSSRVRDERAELARFIIVAGLAVAFVRFFIASPFIVSGTSMLNTFHSGDYLIVDELSFHFRPLQRGEIVVFRFPLDPSRHHIKRVIGLPGETVTVNQTGVHIINKDHPEGMLLDDSYTSTHSLVLPTNVVLGPHEYFVMGDNRDASLDSRITGPVDAKYISGRPVIRLFPFSMIGLNPGVHLDNQTR